VAYPEWADKPFNFGNFRRGARFANSLTNGTVLSTKKSSSGGFDYVTYAVRLSPKTEQGMYDMSLESPTRTGSSGFVLPSNDEWVKAALRRPQRWRHVSYWQYPTGPFDHLNMAVLDPGTGDVTNRALQPLVNHNPNDPFSSGLVTPGAPPGPAPDCSPSEAGPTCADVYPPDLPPGPGNVSSTSLASNTRCGSGEANRPKRGPARAAGPFHGGCRTDTAAAWCLARGALRSPPRPLLCPGCDRGPRAAGSCGRR
jgi:hypothetical protein